MRLGCKWEAASHLQLNPKSIFSNSSKKKNSSKAITLRKGPLHSQSFYSIIFYPTQKLLFLKYFNLYKNTLTKISLKLQKTRLIVFVGQWTVKNPLSAIKFWNNDGLNSGVTLFMRDRPSFKTLPQINFSLYINNKDLVTVIKYFTRLLQILRY